MGKCPNVNGMKDNVADIEESEEGGLVCISLQAGNDIGVEENKVGRCPNVNGIEENITGIENKEREECLGVSLFDELCASKSALPRQTVNFKYYLQNVLSCKMLSLKEENNKNCNWSKNRNNQRKWHSPKPLNAK